MKIIFGVGFRNNQSRKTYSFTTHLKGFVERLKGLIVASLRLNI